MPSLVNREEDLLTQAVNKPALERKEAVIYPSRSRSRVKNSREDNR